MLPYLHTSHRVDVNHQALFNIRSAIALRGKPCKISLFSTGIIAMFVVIKRHDFFPSLCRKKSWDSP